jgi:DNA-binding FrmR family transcriptional regulator
MVLEAHMLSCVQQSFETGADVDQKIGEILRIVDKMVN